MATVTLDGVHKSFGRTEVIHGIDAQISDGEFIVIVGPSGCGKSTLLRMVAGLETVTRGTVSIAGRVVNDVEPMDRDIAMVFQNYALYPHMSVRRNMAYALRIARQPKSEIERRVAEAAAMLQLEPYLDRLPRQLSGGQPPARRHGPRDRARAGRLPVRRAAVQPRREAARRHAPGDPHAPGRSRHYLALRHPRPGGGHDHGRPHDRDERGPRRADRRAARRLPTAGDAVRRAVHRQPGDERARGHGLGRRGADGRGLLAGFGPRARPGRDRHASRAPAARPVRAHAARGPHGGAAGRQHPPCTAASKARTAISS